jgi:hypothetical protein
MAIQGAGVADLPFGRGLGEWGVPVWAGGPVQKRERSYPLMTACLNCGLVVLRGWVVLF